jgi:transcriptional regulator with XRE-family HTH domain
MAVSLKLMEGFAVNLRLHCNKKSTIAEVCRGTQIHRQQFNKYLSGNSFPNAHNLSKICKYLDVSAEKLFAVSSATNMDKRSESQSESVRITIAKQPNLELANFEGSFFEVSNQIQVGSYFCYFPFPGYEGLLLRSYLRIWALDGRLSFSRVTRIRQHGADGVLIAKGRHAGSVMSSTDEITFIGRNRQSPHQVSLINLERKSTLSGIYFGLALTRAAGSSVACRTALEYLGSMSPTRSMLSALGIIPATDKSVPNQIRLTLIQKENLDKHIVFPPSQADILAHLVEQ